MSITPNPQPQNQPQQHQQPASYWSAPPPAAPPMSAYQQPLPMAERPQPPSVAMTVVITLFFGIFGLIAAASASSKATQLGYPTGKYWMTWLLIMVGWFLLVVAMVG